MSDNNCSGAGEGGRGSISDSWVDLSGQLGTTTPPLVAAGGQSAMMSPKSSTAPSPFGSEHDYIRMLREAQRESNRSSTKVSPISSALMSLSSTPKRASPIHSPKSPPNSPNPELASAEELKGVYINKIGTTTAGSSSGPYTGLHHHHHHSGGALDSDQIWDWTPSNIHPRECRMPPASATGAATRSRKASSSNSSNGSGSNGKVSPAGAPLSKLSPRNNAAAKDGKTEKSPFSKVVYTLVITNIISLIIGTGIGLWLKRGHPCGCSGELIEIAL